MFNERFIAQKHFEKGFLHSVWLLNQCENYVMLTEDDIEITNSVESTSLIWDSGMIRFYNSINATHDVILKIAAKSGDPGAIQSYPLGLLTSSEFNEDMATLYPILMHRHLSSPTGWFRSELTDKERARHRAKVYLLASDSIGKM